MMGNSKSSQSKGKNPLESRSPEKRSRANSEKAPKKKTANKNDQDLHEKQDFSTLANGVSRNNGFASTSSEAPLARRPLRNTSIKEPYDAVWNKSTHNPPMVPKVENLDFHSMALQISRDPRMTVNPILDHADDSVENTNDETFSQNLTDDMPAATEPVLNCIIDINVEDVKSEIDHLVLADDNDWKSRFLNGENTIREEIEKNGSNCGPSIRVKTEPIEEEALNPASEPIEDDRCSIDSGSTVGLPSPERASPTPSCPSPRPSEDQAKFDLDDDKTYGTSSNGHLAPETDNGRPVVDSALENDSPAIKNPSTLYYSPATDLEEEYRNLEREKIAAVMLVDKEYSRENSESSSDEEISAPIETQLKEPVFHADDFGDDGEQFGDFDQDMDPSWASPVPPEDSRTGQKRPLPTEEADDINKSTVLPAKKSKFQVLKFPQDGSESIVQLSTVAPTDTRTSTSTVPSSPTSSSNIETPTSKPSELEVGASSSQSATSASKNPSSTRPRIPVKLTTTNRASMMVEDYLNSANINAASVRNKRAVTPSKSTPKRKKQVHSERSASPLSRPVNIEFPNGIAGIHGIHEDNPPPQDVLALTSNARDPRLRRKENKTTPASQCRTPSDAVLNLSRTLKNRILMRVLKLWQFKWLEQQIHNTEPPPLLDQDKNFPVEIPQFSCVPVLTKYSDLQSYYDIFHPLMFHEIWSSLVLKNQLQNKVKKGLEWKCLITSSTKEDAFILLQCLSVLEFETEAPIVNDLVVMTFTRATGELLHPFGFVESSETTKLSKISDLDQTLMPKDKSRAKYLTDVVIRVSKSYAPKKCAPGQKNMTCVMAKITSLTSFMDLFYAQAAFNFSPLRDIILHPRPFAFQLMHSQRLFQMDYLNPLQIEAYLSIGQTMLITPSDQPKIALLEGFPGTGKTHVIVHIINHLLGHKLRDIRPKILYCAPTHAAVDEMTRRLIQMNKHMEPNARFDVLRMGTWSRLHSDIREVTLEDKLIRLRARIKQENPSRKEIRVIEEKCLLLQNLKQSILKELNGNSLSTQRTEELEDKLAEVNDEIETAIGFLENTKKLEEEKVEKDLQNQKCLTIDHADVICTTVEACISADLQFLDRKLEVNGRVSRPFLCCIIDDASLCTEPQTLIPLALGIKKLILVGDVELVPFTLNSSVAKESRLDQSLFSRFHSYLNLENNRKERTIFSLNTQHRMDRGICQWTSKYYYGNRLLTSATLKLNTPLHAYRILDVKDSLEDPDGSSFVNRPEAEVIVKIVECLVRSPDMNERTIGIVTFYEKQRILIRYLLRERMPKDYVRTDVRLVQDVQGSETDIVIISCVKTKIRNRDKNLAMLTEHWNVALTRATESLFICGHFKTLQANEVLKDLIWDADKRQVIQRVSSLFDRSMLYDVLIKPVDYMDM